MSVVGDANIDNQIATAGRVRQVVDDLDISALQPRARGNPLCLNLVPNCHGGLGFVDLRHVTEICAQLRERLERGACHGGLEFVDLRSGVNVRICNLRCTRKCC